MFVIPFNDYPYFTTEVNLDGKIYGFTFQWNSRCSYWTISINDQQGNKVVSGVKVMSNVPLFDRFKKVLLPAGSIVPIFNNGIKNIIGDGDLGTLAQLYYFPE